ncbi:MAG: thioredoxin domain-containing protein [Myxococcota bacterium]
MRLAPVLLTVAACGSQSPASFPMPDHKAVIDLFVMSQCPYGVEAEKLVTPLKEKLGDALEIKINYIGQTQDGEFKSLHGPNEVKGNIAQLCANKQAPAKNLEFIACQNEAVKQVADNWKDCGSSLGLDVAALTTCIDGDEGKELLTASFALATEKKARSSPTILVDGAPYKGARRENDLLRSICVTYGEQAPPLCKDIPEPPVINAVFLSDDRCKECDIHPLEDKLRGQMPGLKVQHMDVKAADGEAMYTKLQAADPNFKFLPAVLLTTAELEKDADAQKGLQRFLAAVGTSEYTSLRVGGKFDPKAEICDNTTDDDGDGLADCADDGCSGQLLCREAMPGKLDLFVMSQCPYGAKALLATHALVDSFGGDVDLTVHYIGDIKDGALSSMHGQAEVDHDIREVCAQAKYPNDYQYLDFMACISKDYKKADWEACARESKMDPAVIQACFDGEGKDLLTKSFASAAELDIGSSPTFLINNKRTFNAVAPDALQKQICQDNPTFEGCGAVVTTDAATAAPVPAGACGD